MAYKQGTCWDGYIQKGMKKKGNKMVPNCVPVSGKQTGGLSGGKRFGPPPERGPNPQGLKSGGCPHRETGAKTDIKGIKDVQVSGKKFIGLR
mgnify:CR=1 FL=1|tara:strand:- start:346 stop:621 length:276 start_codon:yes stop_codon:yes gene_type:complete